MSYFSNWFTSKAKKTTEVAKKVIRKTEDKFDKAVDSIEKTASKIAQIATDLAYKISKGDTVYQKHELETMQILEKDGWKVLCKSSDFPDTKGNGFKAVAFVNDKTKEVLISTAGTVPTDKHDLKDDVYIAAGTYPSKVTEVITMINHVSTLLGTDSNKYIYNFTGHSLGAPLADAGSYETLSQGLRVGTSITFDSPGSKNAINAAIKAGVFSKNVEVSIEDLAEHCVVYNSPHNLINDNPVVSSPHITEPRIVLPTKQVASDAPVQFATESLGVLGYASYLVGKVSSDVINTCAGYLGLTRTLELITNLPGHSLKNFANLCEKPVYQTKGWDTPGDGTLYIDATDALEEIDSTGTEVVAMSNKPVEDYETVLAFSRDDLSRAHGYNDDNLPLSGGDQDFSSMVYIN